MNTLLAILDSSDDQVFTVIMRSAGIHLYRHLIAGTALVDRVACPMTTRLGKRRPRMADPCARKSGLEITLKDAVVLALLSSYYMN